MPLVVVRHARFPRRFLYWLAPIHYVLEGLVVTQFHGAKTKVKGAPGFPPGNEPTLSRFYTSHWDDSFFGGKFVWSHRFQNMIILVRFCVEINSKLGHVNLNAIEQTRNGGNLASMACGVRNSMSTQVAFILFFRFATFYALERINYSTR